MIKDIKVHLIHGDCDFYIFKDLKDTRKKLNESQTRIIEFFGSKSLQFNEIYTALESSDLFLSSGTVVIRNISDGRSFFPFIENLTEYINKSQPQNDLYIFNYGKVLKTSKFYKAVSKVGEIKELLQPKEAEVVKNISKSIKISDDAAKLLFEYTNGNLFQVSNEISKLRNYLIATKKDKIELQDVKEVCASLFSQNNVWNIGSKFLLHKLDPENLKLKADLLKEINYLLMNDVSTMQILYSFYQNILSAIKMKQMINKGKNFRDCMTLGYFFVKDFFDKRDKFDLNKLFEINSELLDYEFALKSGEVEEEIGLKGLIV